MRLKKGVSIRGASTETILAILIVNSIYLDMGYEFVITSCTDGTHGYSSEHYKGDAFDSRTRHMTEDDVDLLIDNVRSSLGSEFDVVYEPNPPHMHVEYDPKRPTNEL